MKLSGHAKGLWRVTLFGCLLFKFALLQAEEQPELPQPLPEPLTLEFALSLVDIDHPDLRRAQAGIDQARARQQLAKSSNGVNSWIEARLRYIDPPQFNPDQTHDDHRLGIFVDKTLYDFGRADSKIDAAVKEVESQQLLYQDSLQQRKLTILKHYFDVVLADIQFYRFNEEMATEFVALDRLRDRNELGQVSDIEILEQESKYQLVRKRRTQSQNLQRITRARLAYTLGRPGQLPDTVSRPGAFPHLQRALPEIETLQAKALEQNRILKALRAEIAAAQSRLGAARAGDNPILTGGAEANSFSKQRANYDKWRVNVTLTVPLTSGGRVDAEMAKERADLYQLQAEMRNAEEQIKQQVLELWMELDGLRIQREQMQAQTDFRELYLDRSRALYELEVKTDLGDAMVRVTETEQEALATDFNMVLGWEKMDALTGGVNQASPKTPKANGG